MEGEGGKNRDNCGYPICSTQGYVNRPHSQVDDIAKLIIVKKYW